MDKGTLQYLYDAAKSDTQYDEYGVPKMDEQKLRNMMKESTVGRRNKVVFEEKEPKFKSCPRYDPCPICDKCRNKASHLYVACQTCQIPICSHTHSDRKKMILRKNFAILVEKETMDAIKKLDEQVTKEMKE